MEQKFRHENSQKKKRGQQKNMYEMGAKMDDKIRVDAENPNETMNKRGIEASNERASNLILEGGKRVI